MHLTISSARRIGPDFGLESERLLIDKDLEFIEALDGCGPSLDDAAARVEDIIVDGPVDATNGD